MIRAFQIIAVILLCSSIVNAQYDAHDTAEVASTGYFLNITRVNESLYGTIVPDTTQSMYCANGTTIHVKNRVLVLLNDPRSDCFITYNKKSLYQALDLMPQRRCRFDASYTELLRGASKLLAQSAKVYRKHVTVKSAEQTFSIWKALLPSVEQSKLACFKDRKLSAKLTKAQNAHKRLTRLNKRPV